jgi:hypothetical protein
MGMAIMAVITATMAVITVAIGTATGITAIVTVTGIADAIGATE